MNKIIGTAGHVDHGKSALIYALTGKSMMRLPEEQKRGMTIDLGFASFKPFDDFTIGVIDVPGHERFIRNMVAGMWSLDLVMLVCCASEGWMQMTEEHAKVAYSLNIKNVICVMNKIDLVDEETLSLQEDDVSKRLLKIFGREIDIVPVSALKNIGIDALKNRITDILIESDSQNKTENLIKPYIYVDRIFSVKGAGATITGSIKNGSIKLNETLIHYPSKTEITVRSLQSYNEDREEVESVSRVAVNMRNIKKEDIKRGDMISTRQDFLFSTKEIILELEEPYNANSYKKLKEIEFAVGSECVIAYPVPLFINVKDEATNKLQKQIDSRFIRLKLSEEVALFWKSRAILISHGGSNIIGAGYIFWGAETDIITRRRITEVAGNFLGERKISEYNKLFMAVMGFMELFDNKENIEIENTIKISNLLVDNLYAENIKEQILKLLDKKQPNGDYIILSLDNIKSSVIINQTLLTHFISFMCSQKNIMLFGGGYKKYQESEAIILTNAQIELLKILDKNGLIGIEEKFLRTLPNGIKDMKVLTATAKAKFLEEGIYYSIDSYKNVKLKILDGLSSGAVISISSAKDRSGVSRKYAIPVLNAMERDGILKRKENDRIVI